MGDLANPGAVTRDGGGNPGRWWRFAVVRGPGIPAELDGRWFDLDNLGEGWFDVVRGAVMTPTDRWEQREDGAVAVRYEWTAGRG